MTYADFEYYRDKYMGGLIAEEDFPRFALRASQYLDYITMGKAACSGQAGALATACCALAEQYQVIDRLQRMEGSGVSTSTETAGQEVKSETVGPWSRTYQSGGEQAAQAASLLEGSNARLLDIARQYLSHTGLLYRGGRCGACSHIR